MTGTQIQFLRGLAWAGRTILSASELGDAGIRDLISQGHVETWRTGPIAGFEAAGDTFLAARITDKGRDAFPEIRRPA